MNEEEENDVPAVANFFSKRAKFVPKISAEEFEATSKLLDEKGKDKYPTFESVVLPSVKKKGIRKILAEEKCVQPVKTVVKNKCEIEDPLVTTEAPLSAAAKRRLQKLQEQQEKELKKIEIENQKVLSALNSSGISEAEEVDANDYDKINVLTISYLSGYSRLTCHENDKFSTIFPKVADKLNLKASEFLLCHGERNIKVDDTPKSLEITASDILECIPYKPVSTSQIESDDNQLKLFFQTSDSKKKIEIFVHKLEKMQDVMEKYSKSQNIPLNKLSFEFDGEQITGTETPEDLDMETGNCIDVTVSTAGEETSACSQKPVKGNEASENVLTVESGDSNDSASACSSRPKRKNASQNVKAVGIDDTTNTRSGKARKRINAYRKVSTVDIASNESVSTRSKKPRKRKN